MTRRDEEYILESMDQLLHIVFENNQMLTDLCNVVNTHLANHNKENEEDFNRNVMANMISNMIELGVMGKNKRQP